MVPRTCRHFTICILCLSPWARPRGEYFHLGERNEDSIEAISAWEGVVVCLVIGGQNGMSDRCLSSPKPETQWFTCQPFCCSMLVMCQYFVLFNNAVICRDYTALMVTEGARSIGGMSLSEENLNTRGKSWSFPFCAFFLSQLYFQYSDSCW
jgi:hypothetical protein